MRQHVSIAGVGYTAVGEHWERSLADLALEAIQAALADARLGPGDVDALVVGNALASLFSSQAHLGPIIAAHAGLHGIEALRIEGADAAGGLALRSGAALISSGTAQTVVVVGVEKTTDCLGPERVSALATLLDAEYEAVHGITPTAVAGLLMRRYMHAYGLEMDDFEGFSINAHQNGSQNPKAMFRNQIKPGRFAAAPMVADPVNLFDVAPEADGAAAVVLTANEQIIQQIPMPIRVVGSAAATDSLALHQREDMLFLRAVNLAAGRAFEQAGITPGQVDILEAHDAYTVLTALQLEAAGFAEKGQGWRLAAENRISRDGDLPVSTFGGLKARGNPLGATGVYQVAEITLQLRGEADDLQVPGEPQLGMALNLGGLGSTATTHLLERVDR
ncbi:MAG: thiolase domain-containing protein [Chloroflexi bacterium]|nr:thiolase domain-containing protein [Chloroflexota bacterium]